MFYSFGIFESINKAKQYFGNQIDENTFLKLRNIDKSKNNKDLPTICYFWSVDNEANIEMLERYFKLYNIFRNGIGTLEYIKHRNEVLLNNQPITFLELTEIIDGFESRRILKKLGSQKSEISSKLTPIWSNDRYKIFFADTQQKCVELGKNQTFCISRGDSSNMWQNYRKNDIASFYFIFDNNPNIKSEEIVVIDARGDGSHILTDKRNSTGYKSFEIYLKENPEINNIKNIFKNKPHSDLEKMLMKKSEISLEDFEKMSPTTKNEYLSLGKKLSKDVWDKLNSEQKNIYINSGAWLNIDDYKKLSESHKKRYDRLTWRKMDNESSYHNHDKFSQFLSLQSVKNIIEAEISERSKKKNLQTYIQQGFLNKNNLEELKILAKNEPSLLSYIKGLSTTQMIEISKHIKKS